MRKLLIAVVAVAMTVAGFSVLASADQGPQGTEWTFSFSAKKKNKPAASNSLIIPAKVDDQGTEDTSDDVYTPPEKSTIRFPKGSSVDTSALARCKLTPSDVGRGEQCPNRTKLGDGEAVSIVGGEPVGNSGQRRGGSPVNATIEAYNQKNKILFIVQPCGGGTGPTTGEPCAPAGSPIVLQGKWSKIATRPKLVVPTPPGLLEIGIVIVRFQLTTNKHTKTRRVKIDGVRRRVVVSFATTPNKCRGQWKSFAIEDYVDGSTVKIPDSQTCRKG